jgi:hypothetical protein
MCGLLLALGLLGCSSWLLGQNGKVPGCSDADTDFLPAGCFDGTGAEETASGTAVLALMQVLVLVTLLELLRWIA